MEALDPAVCADTNFLMVMARMMLSESSANTSVAFLSQKIHVQMAFVCHTAPPRQLRHPPARAHAPGAWAKQAQLPSTLTTDP